MAKTYSMDLRERVSQFVLAGHSCHEAATHFSTSVSFVVNLMRLLRETGSLAARARGGLRHSKLAAHREFLLARVAETPDVTMPELAAALKERGVTVDPSSISHFLLRNGLSYKKLFWPAKPCVRTCARRATVGSVGGSRAWLKSRAGLCSWMKHGRRPTWPGSANVQCAARG